MNPLKAIRMKLHSLCQRREKKREIDEELRFHLGQRTAENIAAGMSPEEVAREAQKRFGNLQSVREECREKRGASFGETTFRDLRFAFRQLLKHPGFAAAAVLTPATGGPIVRAHRSSPSDHLGAEGPAIDGLGQSADEFDDSQGESLGSFLRLHFRHKHTLVSDRRHDARAMYRKLQI